MRFRTELPLLRSRHTLSPRLPLLLMGSCFADNMGARMEQALWPAVANPCGVLFNPLSIERSFRMAALSRDDLRLTIEKSLCRRGEIWSSWLFDSKCSSTEAGLVMHGCLEAVEKLREAMKYSQAIVVTLGTAHAYRLAATGEVVANCHKHPQSLFERTRLSVEDTAAAVKRISEAARALRGQQAEPVPLIFTVSPVRHLADGLHGNNISKSTLLLGLDMALEEIENAEYFEAYELLADDLRDYRYYASDLTHPSGEAVEYIWERFRSRYLDAEGEARVAQGESLWRRLNHRPLVAGTEEEIRFREQTARLLSDFNS